MKFLSRKLRRDILSQWTQFFSVFLMAFLSVLIYTGLEGVWHGMDVSLNAYMKSSHLADSWISAVNLTANDVNKIKKISGVVSQTSLKTTIQVTTSDGYNNQSYLTLETPGSKSLSKPVLVSGKELDSQRDGMYLNTEYAKSHNLTVGDHLTVSYNQRMIILKIIGLIRSPSRIYYTGTNDFVAPNYRSYGFGTITQQTLKNDFHYLGQANLLEISDSNNQKIREEVPKILGSRYLAYYNRQTLPEVSTALDRVGQIRNLSIMFSTLFILLAILAMYTTIRRLIESQTQEIALLKALGYSNRSISRHYASYGLLVSALGALIGTAASPVMSLFVLQTQKTMFSLPNWQIAYTWNSFGIVALVILISTISAFIASHNARSGLPAVYLRGNKIKQTHQISVEKIFPVFWKRISYGSRWTWRDSLANPIRILMGIVGVCGGMALLIAGFGVHDSMYGQVSQSYGQDFKYQERYTFTSTRHLLNIRRLLTSVNGQWLETLTARISPDDGINHIVNIIGKGNLVNIKTTDGKQINDGGIYVTEGLAQSARIKFGQTIKLTNVSTSQKSYQMKVKGILKSSIPQGVYLTQKTWQNHGGNFLPQTLLMKGVLSNKNKELLKTHDVSSQLVTIEKQKANAIDLVNNFQSIFLLIQVFGILLVVVVLYNLGSLSFAERSRDYATLRVLGFHRNEIRLLTVRENVVTTLIGWIIGLPFGFWFLDKYVSTFSTYQIKYYPLISRLNLAFASIITISCALTTTILIGRRIRKLDMVEAIKGVE
ncbi:FtsX-like permease family protein [Sporolactobacillus sp. CQH2019]|uniref:ABC transporter permease n=1 Tax=Sporolactobacillus sp. CQH2019 TaxID=3023512 RepID=UPI002367FE81|nr:ABC transporter permease [Sporolactobacillus sp. CQH2019]MDD9149924.1 FtsX-like permease family protein [Sporolactobacillus sp. CQH2019]